MRILKPLSRQESTQVKRKLSTELFRFQLQETLIRLTVVILTFRGRTQTRRSDRRLEEVIPHVHVIELDDSLGQPILLAHYVHCSKDKEQDLTAYRSIQQRSSHIWVNRALYRRRVLIYLILVKYSLDS